MFMVNSNTKVYIVSSSSYFNGGGELLHQLCDVLNRNRVDAYMLYYNLKQMDFVKANIPEHIKDYEIKVGDCIEDNGNNIIIVPEKYTEPFNRLKNIQKVIWWLGMNQYFWKSELNRYPRLTLIYHWLRYILKKKTPVPPNKIKGNDIQHLSQCWYGVAYLNKKGFHNVGYLSDYINKLHIDLEGTNKRENIVLYNPKRNIEYLKKVMRCDCDIKYIPIMNMTSQEVAELMIKAKVYLDLGSHPGKDRMPREAALHGCCVLTSTEGSADFWNDVPIDSEFKFKRNRSNVKLIREKIIDIFDNYDTYSRRFDGYRAFISELHQ